MGRAVPGVSVKVNPDPHQHEEREALSPQPSMLLPDCPLHETTWRGSVLCPHKICHPGYEQGEMEQGGSQILRAEQRSPRPALGVPGLVIHPF